MNRFSITALLMALVLPVAAARASDERPPKPAQSRVPVCMIVDDPAPFINNRATEDNTVCREIPTSFYVEFGQWAERMGVRGKLTIVPCVGGIAAIDGSLGEFPGHTKQERLEWIDMIKTLYEPRFTITPEVMTHFVAWDIEHKRLMPGRPREDHWLVIQPVEVHDRNTSPRRCRCSRTRASPPAASPVLGHPARKGRHPRRGGLASGGKSLRAQVHHAFQ